MLRRLLEGWVVTPKWWKGFYVAFPLSFAFIFTSTGGDATFAIRIAFLWAISIAIALWASEALKARLRGRREGPRAVDPTVPHGVDPNDLRRRR
ncbi:MAG: hypothetical protein IT299_08925 [Dehalococcoidia bacterium]|nr:hypothetical protein [Dehalococcoidia bacterium]